MFAQFSKKTIFLKFISGTVLICFIFTGIAVRGYAKAAVLDNLRKPATIEDGNTEKISKELILLDQVLVWEKDLKDAKKAKQIGVHQFAKEVLEDIHPKSTILSLGCGSGLDEVFFAKAGHTVVATDFVESAIRELSEKINKESIKNLRTKVQDLTKTFVDFPNESFDIVYSHLSLNFMTDVKIAKAIKEIHRVLKPGGRLYLIAQSVNDKTRGEGKEIEKDTIVRGGKLVHYFSKEYIEKRFADFEFKDEDIITGERVFYPPEGRVIGFIQLKAKKPLPEILEKEKLLVILESRNKENKGNFPPDIRREDEKLFNTLKALRIPIYSKQDQTIYVWDADNLEEALQEQYKQGKNDEAMISIVTIGEDGWPKLRLAEGGALLDLNYRKDRQKQWVQAILANLGFKEFKVPQEAKNVNIFGMTQYVPGLSMDKVILEDIKVVNGLPEVLFKNGIKTVYVFDAEKREFIPAFRGGKEKPFTNEDLEFSSISMPVLMTSEQAEQFKPDIVAQLEGDQYIGWFYHGVPEGLKQIPNNEYWKYVGLSTFPVAGATVKKIEAAQPGTFGLTNLSVPDLNGHVSIKNLDKLSKLFIQRKDGTFEIKEGKGWDSALECLKIADAGVQMIMEAVEQKEGVLVLVGDHGSLDDMTQPNHSFNDVPIFIIDFKNKDVQLVKANNGLKNTQADVAVTILHILGIEKPAEMTGKSLLPDDYVGSKDRVVWQIILDGFGHADFNDPNNAFGVAMKEGMMPAIKSLYDKGNYGILKACSWYAGLRGGRQEDFKEDEIITRDSMIEKIKELKPEKIKITYYDYRDIKEASSVYAYGKGLFELQNSPFLNDKDFMIVNDSADNKIKVLCLDYPQMGSTEYNTWTLGAGRIVEQSVVFGDKLFISGAVSDNQALKSYSEAAKKQGYAHIAGILQEAAVHASARHLYYLIKHLKENGVERFVFDLASDGRDEGKQDCLARIRQLRAALKYFEIEDYTLNIRGREICFDRAKNWKLTEAWINELLYGSRISKREIYRAKPDDKLGGGEKKGEVFKEIENIISNSKGKIKVGLFDIGGVLFNNSRTDVINNFQKAIKIKFGKEIAKDEVEELIFTGESAQKLRVNLPIEDFVDELNNYLQAKFNQAVKFELKEFMDILFLDYEPPLGMVELLRNLIDKGINIYVISNNFISNRFDLKEMIKDKLNSYYSKPGEQEIFNDENLIMSNEIGFAKPNSIAFNKALEKINSELKSSINSENILFFDDQWENVNIARQLGYNVVRLNEEVSGLLNFFDAHSRFFKAVGGEAVLPRYLEDIWRWYETLKSKTFRLDDVKLALVVHSSFFKKGGAIEALNEIIKLQPGHKVRVMLGIYGEGADNIRALFSDNSNIITAKTAGELKLELKNRKVELPVDVVVLKPIGEKIDLEAKQVGFSEKTISTVAVAKAMQVLVGTNSDGKSYSGFILNRFKEFYENMESKEVISNETYENTKTQVFDGLDLPDIELTQGINDITKNDADLISKFIDSFI